MQHIKTRKVDSNVWRVYCLYKSIYLGDIVKTPNGWVFETDNKWGDILNGVFYYWDNSHTYPTKKDVVQALDSFAQTVLDKKWARVSREAEAYYKSHSSRIYYRYTDGPDNKTGFFYQNVNQKLDTA